MDEFIKEKSDLELMLATKKEQVSHAEQEYFRYLKLKDNEVYQFNQAQLALNELKDMTVSAQGHYDTLTKNISGIEKETSEKMSLLNGIKDEYTKLSSEKDAILTEISDKKAEVQTLISEYSVSNDKLGKDKEQYEATSKTFNEKVARLKEVIATL